MKLLLKCPTRGRAQKVIAALQRYASLASHPEDIGVALSCDTTDPTMKDPRVLASLEYVLSKFAWHKIYYSDNTSKIQACNANMDEIDYPWDIVMLTSDDMIPQVSGYDGIIRRFMKSSFPDTDGILWFNDGYQQNNLITLSIYGRRMYERLGNIYNPAYKSFFCDTELTDRCTSSLKDKTLYIPTVIIRHEHPTLGFDTLDDLYIQNYKFFVEDAMTYIAQKKYDYDWSVLVPSLVERTAQRESLLASIREKVARICPTLRVEYVTSIDNRQKTIGRKRQELIQTGRGKYMSFVDDDDDITDAYIEDLVECIKGDYQVMRLYGQMSQYRFMHSVSVGLNDKMVVGDPPLFQRPPNHLNPMLTDIAKYIKFKDLRQGEDMDWAVRLAKTRFLQKEYRSDPSRVHYIYNLGSRTVSPNTVEFQRRVTVEGSVEHLVDKPPPTDAKQVGLRLGSRGFVSR